MDERIVAPVPSPAGATAELRRFALPLICVAQLMATIDVTIVNLALPSIHRELEMADAGLAWVIDAYTLVYGGMLLVGGRCGDLIGQRRTLMVGIAIFTVSSLVAGIAGDSATFLAARAGQGLGAALATPTTLSLITTLTPPGPRRTRAMVAYGAMAGLGITLGLVLGGVLTELASWRWVFLLNLPIGVLLLLSAPRVLPEAHGLRRRLDPVGALLGTLALTSLVYGVIRAGTHDWGETWSNATLVAVVVLFAAFVVVERRVPEPTLPLHLLAHRTRLGAYLVAGLLFACLYPTFLFLSRTMHDVQHLASTKGGVMFLPLGTGVIVFAIVTRKIMGSVGPRVLVVGGTGATAAAASLLLLLENDSAYVAVLLPALVGLGAGVGTTFVANAALAMVDVDERDAGIASGLLSTFQAVGGTIGVAALASVAASVTKDELPTLVLPTQAQMESALMTGFHYGFGIAAAMAFAGLVVALVCAPKEIYAPSPEEASP